MQTIILINKCFISNFPFRYWCQITRWQRTGRVYLAGVITLVVGVLIWISSLPQIRRKNFQFFYFAHHLYVVFIIFFLLHAGSGHFYLVFSGVLLFALDKLLRIIQSARQTCVISARILPCKAVELRLPKDPCEDMNNFSFSSTLQWFHQYWSQNFFTD